jgi:hypothetical protein
MVMTDSNNDAALIYKLKLRAITVRSNNGPYVLRVKTNRSDNGSPWCLSVIR